MKATRLAVIPPLLLAFGLAAGEPSVFPENDEGCMEGPVAQFGRYVGDWKIDDEVRAKDGSGWSEGKGARWIFECVGNGLAVQDYWMPNGGGLGTNLRSYNPDTGDWEIVWTASTLNGFLHIRAKQNDAGNIVMEIVSPEQDPPRRIIFFEPDENGWNWVQQWSFDGGASWTDVYRIKATPWPSNSADSSLN
jgi:hypothetical protein